ncbi:pectinesterase QRT1 [Cryptomeria japonica]|uniref:pectinesterase QRT1 n=1 Tax=Cryptomeria japonica TaxID=3369 RepID=UPI0027D9D209|nr:pectinesterase QRT1 [Cryptomeria japonica]
MGKVVAWAMFIILLLQIYPTTVAPNYMISKDDVTARKYMSYHDCYFDPLDDSNDDGNNIDVAQDDTALYTTVQDAIDSIPEENSRRVKIFIRAGKYREKVKVPWNKPFISFIGDGIGKTILSWNDNASSKDSDGNLLGTSSSASTTIESVYFCATGITFENTAPVPLPGAKDMQAVALRVVGDKAVFIDCQMVGHQDTLYDHSGKHFFLRCFIEGSIDFICGNARSLYQNCILTSNAESWGAIAASQSLPNMATGFSFVECKVRGSGNVYLGRAWSNYSTIVYSNCQFDNIIDPRGWDDMTYTSRRSTTMFGEFNCSGPGATKTGRVSWETNLSFEQAQLYQSRQFIDVQDWLNI